MSSPLPNVAQAVQLGHAMDPNFPGIGSVAILRWPEQDESDGEQLDNGNSSGSTYTDDEDAFFRSIGGGKRLISADTVKLLSDFKSAIIRPVAKYRAVYIAADKNREKLLESFGLHLCDSYVSETSAQPMPRPALPEARVPSDPQQAAAEVLLSWRKDRLKTWKKILKIRDDPGSRPQQQEQQGEASNDQCDNQICVSDWVKFLAEFEDFNPYFRDRDGQTMMHYIAKHAQNPLKKNDLDSLFREMVLTYGYNPLLRDHNDRSAFDLASAHIPDSLLTDYVGKKYIKADDKLRSSLQLYFVQPVDPKDEVSCTAKDFISGELDEGLVAVHKAVEALKGGSPLWIYLDINDDVLFSAIISRVCQIKGFAESQTRHVLRFHSSTFLEVMQDTKWLQYRKATCASFSLPGDAKFPEIQLQAITLPFFDTGEHNTGEKIFKKFSQTFNGSYYTNVQVQRTLNASYYIGLTSEQLSQRDQSDSTLPKRGGGPLPVLVSQLWVFQINNVIITAFPGTGTRPGSHLFDHTLSVFRGLDEATRKCLNEDSLLALILSECIHRPEYPCKAGLDKPLGYYLADVVANTLQEVEGYMKRDFQFADRRQRKRLKSSDQDLELEWAEWMNKCSVKLMMMKNIIMRQEEVWGLFRANPRNKAFIDVGPSFERLNVDEEKSDHGQSPASANMEIAEAASRSVGTQTPLLNSEASADLEQLVRRPPQDFKNLNQRLNRIESDKASVENLIQAQLNIKAKYNGYTVSLASVAFAVVAIVFAPLAFFTSLLALPVANLERTKQESPLTKNWAFSLKYLVGWLGIGELVSIVITLAFLYLFFHHIVDSQVKKWYKRQVWARYQRIQDWRKRLVQALRMRWNERKSWQKNSHSQVTTKDSQETQ